MRRSARANPSEPANKPQTGGEAKKEILTREEELDSIRRIAMTNRAQTEDQKFLSEENARRRSFADAQIARLLSTIDSARREIARLEAGKSYRIAVKSEDSAENNARRARIAILQTHIADCDRQIQILSDAIAGWN